MKKNIQKLIFIIMVFSASLVANPTDGNYVFSLETATETFMNAISNPQQGMMIYNTTDNKVYDYNGTTWGIVGEELVPATSDIKVDQSFLAKATVTGNSNGVDLNLTLTHLHTDTGWTIVGNEAIYSSSADYVKISAMTYMEENPPPSASSRISPVLELLKNGIVVARSATGYQRHTRGHNSSSNSILYVDYAPISGDTYRLRAQQGSERNAILNIDLGHFDLIAVKKVTVLQTTPIP